MASKGWAYNEPVKRSSERNQNMSHPLVSRLFQSAEWWQVWAGWLGFRSSYDVTDLKAPEIPHGCHKHQKLHMACRSESCGLQSLTVAVGSGQLTCIHPAHATYLSVNPPGIQVTLLKSPCSNYKLQKPTANHGLCLQICCFLFVFRISQAGSEKKTTTLETKELRSPQGHGHTSIDSYCMSMKLL